MVLGAEGPKNVVEPTQISSEAVCLTGFRCLRARWLALAQGVWRKAFGWGVPSVLRT